jgi:hypothetical protein
VTEPGTAALDEVIGHSALKRRLASFVEAGRLVQGILFVGEEGRGKRTLAHALARLLLERDAPAAERVRVRKAIAGGTHPGLMHVEPLRDERFLAVRRVRRLLEACSLKVGWGSARIVVLARLHCANEESGNALLKFLEEPPRGTVVLATARDAASVLETIRSRFHVLEAGPLEAGEVDRVLERGGFAAEDRDVLVPLARGAPGAAWSFARGDLEKSLLQPLRSFFDGRTPLHAAMESLVKVARDEGPKCVESREAVGPAAAVRALADLRSGAEGDDERRGETTLEAARVWLRPVVEGVACVLQELLRDRAGSAHGRAVLLPRVVPAGSPIRDAAIARVAAALQAAVDCLENIDHNLTLGLALEALALRVRTP